MKHISLPILSGMLLLLSSGCQQTKDNNVQIEPTEKAHSETVSASSGLRAVKDSNSNTFTSTPELITTDTPSSRSLASQDSSSEKPPQVESSPVSGGGKMIRFDHKSRAPLKAHKNSNGEIEVGH